MLKIKSFLQTQGHCGPFCLKSVFDYYGLSVSAKKIANVAKTNSKYGTSPKNMVMAAKYFGFNAIYKEKSDIQELHNLVVKCKIPVIVNWFSENEGHYSVVIGFKKKIIYLQDPEIGNIKSMKIEDFLRVWFDFTGDYIRLKSDLRIRSMIIVKKI